MRGVGGAVILGLPLIYTQEVWVHGATLPPIIILLLLVVSFGLNFILSHYVGFESGRTFRPFEDAVIGFGSSFILAAGLLLLLGRVDSSMEPQNILGIVGLSSIPISLGFVLGNALAPVEGGKGSDEMKGGGGDLLAAGAGAVVLSLNIAPTEEPLLLAYQLGIGRLAGIFAISLVLSFFIVFFADFGGVSQRAQHTGPIHSPIVETLLAYLIAFLVAGALLAAFGEIDGFDGASLSEVVVLSFPASMGAALGRLLV